MIKGNFTKAKKSFKKNTWKKRIVSRVLAWRENEI
jgi:hypothetical protein